MSLREGAVTHIGDKGYAYCGPCAKERRASRFERVRKLLVRERRALEAGERLASYDREPEKFCTCGRRESECDGSRAGCAKRGT